MGYELGSVFICFYVGERNGKEEERASGRGAGERGKMARASGQAISVVET
jgi:hypothetical protein